MRHAPKLEWVTLSGNLLVGKQDADVKMQSSETLKKKNEFGLLVVVEAVPLPERNNDVSKNRILSRLPDVPRR